MEINKSWLKSLKRFDLVSCKGGRNLAIGVVEKVTDRKILVRIYEKYISRTGLICYTKNASFFSRETGRVSYWQIVPLECHRSIAESFIAEVERY